MTEPFPIHSPERQAEDPDAALRCADEGVDAGERFCVIAREFQKEFARIFGTRPSKSLVSVAANSSDWSVGMK